jgi:hypothetical protein
MFFIILYRLVVVHNAINIEIPKLRKRKVCCKNDDNHSNKNFEQTKKQEMELSFIILL